MTKLSILLITPRIFVSFLVERPTSFTTKIKVKLIVPGRDDIEQKKIKILQMIGHKIIYLQ